MSELSRTEFLGLSIEAALRLGGIDARIFEKVKKLAGILITVLLINFFKTKKLPFSIKISWI